MRTQPDGPKRRLGREEWISAALETMAARGINAVTVEGLATQLGITRGSFYHHFKNREDLLRSMLEFWLDRWTTEIRETARALQLDGRTSLTVLSKLIRKERAAHFDAVVRSWAHRDPLAAEYVEKADKIRIDYIRDQFKKLGFRGQDLEVRARLYYFYEAFEPIMMAAPKVGTADKLSDAMIEILTKR